MNCVQCFKFNVCPVRFNYSYHSVTLRGECPYKLATDNNIFPYPGDLPLDKAAPSDLG